jgi:6-phosphogluconolactonase/glucosamine-6-phosphate isomerase/deaminase
MHIYFYTKKTIVKTENKLMQDNFLDIEHAPQTHLQNKKKLCLCISGGKATDVIFQNLVFLLFPKINQ